MLSMGAVNINAASKIGDMDAVYFSASFFQCPNINYFIEKNIVNISLYTENQIQCDTD